MKIIKKLFNRVFSPSQHHDDDSKVEHYSSPTSTSSINEDNLSLEDDTPPFEDKKAYIGVIDWFNVTLRYGVIRTQRRTLKLPLSEKTDEEIELFFIVSPSHEADFKPGDWVKFKSIQPKKHKEGYYAKKVRHLTPQENMLDILTMALKFRGPAAAISRVQFSGKIQQYYVLEMVLFTLLYHIRVSKIKIRQEIERNFTNLSPVQKENIICEIASEPHNQEVLRDLYFPLTPSTPLRPISVSCEVSRLFSKIVAFNIIQEQGFERLSQTSLWADSTFRHNLIYVLIAYESNLDRAFFFAEFFDKDDLLQTFYDQLDPNLSYAARAALTSVLDEPLWLTQCSPHRWSTFIQWLASCNPKTKAWILWHYCANKKIDFIENHSILPLIDREIFTHLVQDCCHNTTECETRQSFLTLLLEKSILENNEFKASLLKTGMTVITFCTVLNRLVSKNPKCIIQFLQEFPIFDMFSLQETCTYLNDAALICLYMVTENEYPLNLCRNLADTSKFWEKLDLSLIQQFLRLYLPSNTLTLNPDDDWFLSTIGPERISEALAQRSNQ